VASKLMARMGGNKKAPPMSTAKKSKKKTKR
jgi:hypothetical protein